MARDFDVNVPGLREFRRDLRKQDPETVKELQKALKGGVEIIRAGAAAIAPRRTGRLAEGYRAFTRGNVAGVRNPVPYAGVIEYGGVISPKGVPITIRRYGPVTTAVERNADRIVEAVADGVDAAARRTGWH